MDVDIRPCASAEEVRQAISPIGYYFGRSAANEDQTKRFARVLPVERVYAAWEGGCAVGGLAALPLQLTVPGERCRRPALLSPASCRRTGDGGFFGR
jgi:hypothetical protein